MAVGVALDTGVDVGAVDGVAVAGAAVGDGGHLLVDEVFRRYFTDSASTCDVELWTEAAVVVCAVASGTATGDVRMRRA